MIAFMHAVHGSDHHVIAFVKSDGPGLHHLSWDVGSINDIGLGAMQMADRGFSAGWGLGRHVLGSNYFHYVRDPWGSYAEYCGLHSGRPRLEERRSSGRGFVLCLGSGPAGGFRVQSRTGSLNHDPERWRPSPGEHPAQVIAPVTADRQRRIRARPRPASARA